MFRIMKLSHWPRSPGTTGSFGVILFVLVLNGIVVHRNSIALHRAYSQVIDTHETISLTEHIFFQQLNAETGVRGYALTGKDAYLEPFSEASKSLATEFSLLRVRVADTPDQTAKIESLESLVFARLEHLKSVISARSESGAEGASNVLLAGVSGQQPGQTSNLFRQLKEDEETRLSVHTEFAAQQLYIILAANLCMVCAGLLISGVAWRSINSHVRHSRIAEANAHAERENLMVTLVSIGDAVIVTDSHGRVQMANPVAEQLLGFPEDVIGRKLEEVFSVIHESSHDPVPNPVDEVLRLGRASVSSTLTLLVRQDGVKLPIEESASPIRDKSGRVVGVILVFRDCSQRRDFEKQLQAREQHFRRMLETPLIGIAVCTPDGKRLLEANDAFLSLIGHTRGSLDGSDLNWEGASSLQGPLDEAAQRELRETGICRPSEKACRRSDGRIVPVLISANRLSSEEDRIIVFVMDLSESKQSEASLKESENRFLILSESMPQIVWLADIHGDFSYVNHTLVSYSGRSAIELKDSGWAELIHPDDRAAYMEAWSESVSSALPFEAESRLEDSAGNYRWHLTRALPMYNDLRQITQWVGTTTDMHDQKVIEAILKEEHLRKDQFLAMLAHELRNPLAPLANVVEVLSAAPHDAGLLADLLPVMKRKIRLLTRLINDLLDVARLTQGCIALNRRPSLVSTIVSEAVEAAQPLISEFQHQLTVTMPSHDIRISADSGRIVQALTNVLQNAAKYTGPKGKIDLTVAQSDCEVTFSVRDNGQGISPAMLNRIFDLFIHAEPNLERVPGGLGIGLSMVRTVIELHGGTVSAKSKGLGHGSEFVISLPLMDSDERTEVAAKPRETTAAATESLPAMRILVVDDVKASAKTLAMMLKVLGQDAEMTFDGASAIERLTEKTFDVVFLDIAMPGMDGLEVARHLRAVPSLSSLTIVALTGFGQEDDRHRSLVAGIDEHLLKPTSINLLQEVLQRASQKLAGSP